MTYTAPKAPKVPNAPKTMTIDQFAKQQGMDYSRNAASTQANAEAKARQDAIANQQRAVNNNVRGAADSLDRNYFLQGLQQTQNQSNSGLNAGIASDQNLRMAMSRQANMGGIHQDANNERMRLNDDLGRVELERIARENSLYNDRRQQGFQNTMMMNDFNRRNFESDRGFDRGVFESDRGFGRGVFESDRGFNEGVRQFDANMDWNKHTFNNLSAAQKKAASNASAQSANFAKLFEDMMKQQGQPAFQEDLYGIPFQNYYTSNPHFRDFMDGEEQAKRRALGQNYIPFF